MRPPIYVEGAVEFFRQAGAAFRRNTPKKGPGTKIQRHAGRAYLSAEDADEFAHPWQLSFAWREDPKVKAAGGRWIATVRPGFVNGRDVTIAEKRDGTDREVTLTDEQPPALVFTGFRNLTTSPGESVTAEGEIVQGAAEGYPPYFADLGAKPAFDPSAKDAEPDPTRTRQIFACDVVLITPRLATKQTVKPGDPLIDAQTGSIETTLLNTELRRATSAHRLEPRSKHMPLAKPTEEEKLMGLAEEPQTDELKLSTVYFLSPPDAPDDAEPDATWTPFAQYFVFWNLAHAAQAQIPDGPVQPLEFFLPLAGGIAQPLVNALLSPINDSFDQISAYLNAGNFQGMYWAPGGIGLDATKRPEPKSTKGDAKTGLKPAARRAQKEAAARKAATTPPLTPSFPYLRTRFDPFFFRLQDDPPAAASV